MACQVFFHFLAVTVHALPVHYQHPDHSSDHDVALLESSSSSAEGLTTMRKRSHVGGEQQFVGTVQLLLENNEDSPPMFKQHHTIVPLWVKFFFCRLSVGLSPALPETSMGKNKYSRHSAELTLSTLSYETWAWLSRLLGGVNQNKESSPLTRPHDDTLTSQLEYNRQTKKNWYGNCAVHIFSDQSWHPVLCTIYTGPTSFTQFSHHNVSPNCCWCWNI